MSVVNHTTIAGRAAIRYLALGDSYTIGESVRPFQRWPEQLAARLRQRGFSIRAPTIIARTGWTTGELWDGIEDADPHGTFELVSLLIGVNNQYRGLDVNHYRDQFRRLLGRALAFAGGQPRRVLVLSIPDWGVTPFASGRDAAQIAREIDRFNAANRVETAQVAARYVDVTPTSRVAAIDRSLVAPDGLHPSGQMYALWVELALPEVLAALGSGP